MHTFEALPGWSSQVTSAMDILFNGQPRTIVPGTTIAALLVELELDPKRLAVEVNCELVPRGQHANHRIEAGDVLEVVTLVGGG